MKGARSNVLQRALGFTLDIAAGEWRRSNEIGTCGGLQFGEPSWDSVLCTGAACSHRALGSAVLLSLRSSRWPSGFWLGTRRWSSAIGNLGAARWAKGTMGWVFTHPVPEPRTDLPMRRFETPSKRPRLSLWISTGTSTCSYFRTMERWLGRSRMPRGRASGAKGEWPCIRIRARALLLRRLGNGTDAGPARGLDCSERVGEEH